MALKRALQLQERKMTQEAVKKNRKGFTLVELVVALAVFIVIISISFSVLSRFFAMRSAQEQEMILQQNFRFALDKMAYDFRQASKDPDVSGDIILEPGSNAMGEELAFCFYDGTYVYDIYYVIESGGSSGTFVLKREKYKRANNNIAVDPSDSSTYSGVPEKQPITEDMHQLVKVYFVRSGGKVTMIVVGNLEYFGKERTISFTSLVFSRNSSNEPSSP
jgi:prepilin-type N-terminal cleavage/methylation domain-containing protein